MSLNKHEFNKVLYDNLRRGTNPKNLGTYLRKSSHYIPQYDFVVGPLQTRMVDTVLQMEQLPLQFMKLMQAYQSNNLTLQKVNTGHPQVQLGVQHMNHKVISTIHKFYPNDFVLGNYSKERLP